MRLHETTLVLLGSPAAGTVLAAVPLAAVDLPLKVLVWEARDGRRLRATRQQRWRRRYSVEVATATEWSELYELAAWGAVPVNPGRRSVPGEGEVLGEGERPLGQDS